MPKTQTPGWGEQWLAALEAAGWGARLKRGAAALREGQVTDLRVRPGQAEATVPDPGGTEWRPRLAVRPLSAPEWTAAATAILRDPAGAAALDAGTWPPALGPVLAGAGIPLLPGADDLAADCACGARMPCRHIAALAYAVAAALDADPWLLPLLRGRSRAALGALLAETRAALVEDAESAPFAPGGANSAEEEDEAAGARPLAEGTAPGAISTEHTLASRDANSTESTTAAASFWDLGADLTDFHPEISAPAQPAPLLRALGPPPFWRPPAAFAAHLEPVYTAVTAAILRLVQTDDEVE